MKGRKKVSDINSFYGGKDPRDIPAYHIREAVRYIRVPYGNLYRWCFGVKPTKTSCRKIAPLIKVSNPPYLSFWNLAEVYILAGILRDYGVTLQSARRAVSYVETHMHVRSPLLTQQFATDGIDLFIAAIEHEQPDLPLINASQGGQVTIKAVMQDALKRVSRDYNGLIKSIYPYTNDSAEARVVEIDPRRSFGRPVVVGTRVPTEVLASRWQAGDSIDALASDFELSPSLIESALRWEKQANAKAA